MQLTYDFLQNLTLVLGVAAVITVVFQKLHQPVVLGYILAGMIGGLRSTCGIEWGYWEDFV